MLRASAGLDRCSAARSGDYPGSTLTNNLQCDMAEEG